MPHLSLMYGNFDAETKKQMVASSGENSRWRFQRMYPSVLPGNGDRKRGTTFRKLKFQSDRKDSVPDQTNTPITNIQTPPPLGERHQAFRRGRCGGACLAQYSARGRSRRCSTQRVRQDDLAPYHRRILRATRDTSISTTSRLTMWPTHLRAPRWSFKITRCGPHDRLRQTSAYGLRMNKTPQNEIDQRVHRDEQLVEMPADLLKRRPTELVRWSATARRARRALIIRRASCCSTNRCRISTRRCANACA